MAKILITGTAGFIGFHLVKVLLEKKNEVIGIDNINDYYDINLKYARLNETGILKEAISWGKEVKSTVYSKYTFIRGNIEDKKGLERLFNKYEFDIVINLAAQAGVRYSIENPEVYVQSNVVGFLNILECCRNYKIKHLLYASSSSVYGENEKIPFSVTDNVDHPISLYAATKKSNELMAHTYSHLFNIPTTGLRFFTAYGPWGRPDMAIFLFTKGIIEGKSIKLFNKGHMKRDFTYIDDIINGIEIMLKHPPVKINKEPAYNLVNIGNGKPESLVDFIKAIENSLQIKAIKEFLPMQAGDVSQTWADTTDLNKLGYASKTSLNSGIEKFVKWYNEFYKLS